MRNPEQFGIFTGRASPAPEARGPRPLVIAIHGGTYHSGYFDVAGYSLLDRAEANGIRAIAIDRHGYGGTAFADDMSIMGQARALGDTLPDIWERHRGGTAGIVLIGHSIGAAIALGIASDPGALPVLGIAVSGIGVRTPGAHSGMWNALPDLPHVEMPGAIKDQLMFGPQGSFAPDMPNASHEADAPVPKAELVDIVGGWQQQAETVCAKIAVPVHYRQAEQDQLWVVDDSEIQAFAHRFPRAPKVDAAMMPDTGHCIDFHKVGPALQMQQLGFALQCAVEHQTTGSNA